jgi:hypothetical protein
MSDFSTTHARFKSSPTVPCVVARCQPPVWVGAEAVLSRLAFFLQALLAAACSLLLAPARATPGILGATVPMTAVRLSFPLTPLLCAPPSPQFRPCPREPGPQTTCIHPTQPLTHSQSPPTGVEYEQRLGRPQGLGHTPPRPNPEAAPTSQGGATLAASCAASWGKTNCAKTCCATPQAGGLYICPQTLP